MITVQEAMTMLSAIKEGNEQPLANDGLVESVNSSTLKQVMLAAAELLAAKNISKNTSYDIHHLDYNNKNNSLDNISLMPSRLHDSFHSKARHLDSVAKKDLLFNNGGYADRCIKIGQLIKNLAIENGEYEEKEYTEDNFNLTKIYDFVLEQLKSEANIDRLMDNGNGSFTINIIEWYSGKVNNMLLRSIKKELMTQFNCISVDVNPEYISGFIRNE